MKVTWLGQDGLYLQMGGQKNYDRSVSDRFGGGH